MLIIVTARQWNNPVELVWLSKPLQYVSQLVAETEQGETLPLSPDFFGSYDYNFTFQGFHEFRPNPKGKRLGFGVSREVFYFFTVERTDREILEFEKTAGQDKSNENRRKKSQKFLDRYIQNFNRRDITHQRFSWLKAPDLLWQGNGVTELPSDARIVRLALHYSTHYYSDTLGPRVIREEKNAVLPIAK